MNVLVFLFSGRNYWECFFVIYLFGKEYFKGAIFMYNGFSWFFIRFLFEQKYKIMNRFGNEIKIYIKLEYEYKIVQLNFIILNSQGI